MLKHSTGQTFLRRSRCLQYSFGAHTSPHQSHLIGFGPLLFPFGLFLLLHRFPGLFNREEGNDDGTLSTLSLHGFISISMASGHIIHQLGSLGTPGQLGSPALASIFGIHPPRLKHHVQMKFLGLPEGLYAMHAPDSVISGHLINASKEGQITLISLSFCELNLMNDAMYEMFSLLL